MNETNPLIKSLLERRSIRKFSDEKISKSDMSTIVECGQMAPTGGNTQLYSFIEVRDKTLRKEITEICHGQEFINEASHYFIICADVRRLEKIMQQVELHQECPGTLNTFIYSSMDAVLAAQNMVVAADALGYGSIYIGSVTNKMAEVSDFLKIPRGVLPVVGLAIGIPAENPPLRPRLPQEMIWHIDKYQDPSPEKLIQASEHMNEKLRQEGYYARFQDTSNEEYTWAVHMCRKFQVKNVEKADQKQKDSITRQGFLDYI